MSTIKEYLDQNKDRFLEELKELLRIPSISADPEYKQDMLKTAEVVKSRLLDAGCDTAEVCETPGHPVVYAEKILDKDLPTVLVYGHYDVQPPDPLDLWDSPPFEPVVKKTDIHPEGAIFARGACDDKGQMYMHVKALEYMTQNGELPCNVKFMIEGEEEVGSEHLEWFIKENKDRLQNEVILISDTGMIAKDVPSITTGLRGLSYVEVEVTGANRDLHSGLYGGAVANPLNVLSQMIASLTDENNHITIPGFYDQVEELSEEERQKMAEAPFSLEEYQKKLDINNVHGEKGYSTLERASIRPTLDVNGMWGGYIGEGAKTVLPSKAYAKISMRLVPDQDWKKITELFQKHFESLAPDSVRVKVKPHHGGYPYVTPIDTVGYQAASKAYEKTFGKTPIPQRSGGSIPIVSLFEKELDSKIILMGFGLDTDAIHSPNENFGVWNYLKGIETIPWFYKYFTEMHQQ
ncbi:MAG: dipeptidase [Bacteroidota bacterium]|mgnify:CR=1 FL=1|uniref:Acetylornithine deacetylase/Succinyl-diaminopimelate desuccinylase and related deacylases n=1 Tax=Christiangramia flava JLT2011 TaxID=1229726 RepID=A0A1L7I4L4_9FLAO|nr:dipeptidase [Christiangramia flava]APU68558.1 Acetylornithine deacetylase/Succinyl-diaminopimelate desuccinylase and related deacylases [Christiangramia flava JLT2011]MAM18370.1 peptidase dimerization domain protein [Christiangramia sp.]MEE2772876.1 dipeptidase [Bacteroidota bacterium]OSS40655.1 Acetylornithine deacetylase/Succinyl-diaminopimelate desuccinylase [Christiangramia flava JLT2011]